MKILVQELTVRRVLHLSGGCIQMSGGLVILFFLSNSSYDEKGDNIQSIAQPLA